MDIVGRDRRSPKPPPSNSCAWLAGLLAVGLALELAARPWRRAAGSSRPGDLLVRSGTIRPGEEPVTRLAAGATVGLVAMALLGANVAAVAGGFSSLPS